MERKIELPTDRSPATINRVLLESGEILLVWNGRLFGWRPAGSPTDRRGISTFRGNKHPDAQEILDNLVNWLVAEVQKVR